MDEAPELGSPDKFEVKKEDVEDTADDPNAGAVDDPSTAALDDTNVNGEPKLPAVDKKGLAGELGSAPKEGNCPIDPVPDWSNKPEDLPTKLKA